MHIAIQSKDLANLEKTLQRRFGGKAARKFMMRVANLAIQDAEIATIKHLTTRYQINPDLVRKHIYFRQKSDGKSLAIVAWSPTRTIPVKQLNPVQTATGVRWRWAGRSRSRKHAFLLHGHAFRRKKVSGQLVSRLPIEKVKGPKISWDDAWDNSITEIVSERFFSEAKKWMNEKVR